MTNTNIQAILDQKLQGVEARKFTAELTKDFGVANQSELLMFIADIVAETDNVGAEQLALFLNLKAQQLLPKATKGGQKKMTEAQKFAQESAEKIMSAGLKKQQYYDSVGVMSVANITKNYAGKEITSNNAGSTMKVLEELGYIVALEKNQKFSDGKTRKTYVLAEQDLEKEFVAYDYDLVNEVIAENEKEEQ